MRFSSSKTTNYAMVFLVIAVPIYLIFVVRPISILDDMFTKVFALVKNEMEIPERVTQKNNFIGANPYVVAGSRIGEPTPQLNTQLDTPPSANIETNPQTDTGTVVQGSQLQQLPESIQPKIDPYGVANMARPIWRELKQPAQLPATTSTTATALNGAIDKILQEGHWIGLEVIPLTANIALANNIPLELKGVLVDEVTLLSAQSGILAGDVITAIGAENVTDLKSFQEATKKVANTSEANINVYREGMVKDIALQSTDVFGMAQMEAAPMILATDRAPHGYYGPCDKCHTISNTNKNVAHLQKDAGDVLTTTAPVIKWGATAPHMDRGVCINCHKIIM